MILPRPWHSEHVRWLCIRPNGVSWITASCPLPLHLWQVFTDEESFAPLPWQWSHSTSLRILIVFFVPKTASSKLIRMRCNKSSPWRGALGLRRDPPPPKKLEKISPRSSKPPENPEKPPPKPPKPPCPAPPSNAAWPNWSYWAFLVSSLSTSYASEISLNLSSAPGSLLISGWYCFDNLRYAFLISAALALLLTPSTS